jgi:rhomboid protease GluP
MMLSTSTPFPMATTLPSLDELLEREPHVGFIGPIVDRQQAREWALVLQSQGIAYVVRQAYDEGESGIVLQIAGRDYERAMRSLELYEEENENWPPPRGRDEPRHESSAAVPAAFVLALLFFLYATGPVAGGSAWFSAGRADASLLASEPWRMVTALTLHADVQHAIGNAISGSIFGMMLGRRIGPGGALLGLVLAGTFGNALNAFYHLSEGHRSIGASTAVFGAIGMLAAVQTALTWGRQREEHAAGIRRFRWIDVIAPIVGGATLLGALGAGGGNTDVWAHGFGFVAGAALGVVAGLWVRKRDREPARWLQLASAALAGGIVLASWALALA